jgi:hypothetical protein
VESFSSRFRQVVEPLLMLLELECPQRLLEAAQVTPSLHLPANYVNLTTAHDSFVTRSTIIRRALPSESIYKSKVERESSPKLLLH